MFVAYRYERTGTVSAGLLIRLQAPWWALGAVEEALKGLKRV